MEVLLSGKTSFKIEVPYRLYENGPKGEKPLIIYFHGLGQNIQIFEEYTKNLQSLNAYHLFIQGPHVDLRSGQNGKPWGYAWYLYNGNQQLFAKSLEYTSEFVQEVIDNLLTHIKVNRIGVFGYSMGGYQAAYFGLSRWKHVQDIAVIGCRIKTELFDSGWENRKHIHVLALHGKKDHSVKADPQRKEIEFLKSQGLIASFKEVDQGHKLNEEYINNAKTWFIDNGYYSL